MSSSIERNAGLALNKVASEVLGHVTIRRGPELDQLENGPGHRDSRLDARGLAGTEGAKEIDEELAFRHRLRFGGQDRACGECLIHHLELEVGADAPGSELCAYLSTVSFLLME